MEEPETSSDEAETSSAEALIAEERSVGGCGDAARWAGLPETEGGGGVGAAGLFASKDEASCADGDGDGKCAGLLASKNGVFGAG